MKATVFLVISSFLLCVQCVVVEKSEEERAIALIKQLIQDLEQDRSNPPRVINVTNYISTYHCVECLRTLATWPYLLFFPL